MQTVKRLNYLVVLETRQNLNLKCYAMGSPADGEMRCDMKVVLEDSRDLDFRVDEN